MRHHKNGLLVISLDFELLWGVRDKRTIKTYGENLRGVKRVIPSLIQVFDKYNIHATFATVGFLFAKDKKQLQQYIPAVLPAYSQQRYSPYGDYFDAVGESEKEDIYHYAFSLLQLIKENPNHEIASHTFSHYYCLENASLESFKADMIAAKKIASAYDIDLKSIVFPRNQYTSDHIAICKDLGFLSYRGNETSSLYRPRKNDELNKTIRVRRFIDSYINLTGHHTFTLNAENEIVNIPASRFLRPYNSKLAVLESLRLSRIKKSILYAARNNQVYHLWWHPHNFGINLEENINFLEEILKYYKVLSQKFGMQSKNMKEIAQEILLTNAV